MKKLMIVFAVLLAILVPVVSFAATSDTAPAKAIRGFCGFDTSKLSDQQKADMLTAWTKMMDSKKEFVNKMVENGSVTKEQGDVMLKNIDDMIKNHQENGFSAMGPRSEMGRKEGMMGKGGHGANCDFKEKGQGRGPGKGMMQRGNAQPTPSI